MVAILLVVLGLVGLWLGTKLVINGSLGLAKKFNLSHAFVGVAILAIGTDLPEVFVSLTASINQLKGIESSGIIIGNAIGSAIGQITLILGIAGLIIVFRITKEELLRHGIALLVSIILIFLFGFDGIVTRVEGIFLLICYLLYFYSLISRKNNHNDNNDQFKDHSNLAIWLMLIPGFAMLIFFSHLVVENALKLAAAWGVSQSFIGIAIVGIGTSLPELAVSIGAAFRGNSAMSVGNIIGSNIFDGFVPIGIGGVISTVRMEQGILWFDLPFLLGTTIIVLLFLISKRGVSTLESIAMILMFIAYLALKIWTFDGVTDLPAY